MKKRLAQWLRAIADRLDPPAPVVRVVSSGNAEVTWEGVVVNSPYQFSVRINDEEASCNDGREARDVFLAAKARGDACELWMNGQRRDWWPR